MAQPSRLWPEPYEGALSLTFDDGLPSQLHTALPLLAEHGLAATFYLNPRGDDFAEALAPWQPEAAAGHEIGNHSLTHTCSRGFADSPDAPGLEGLTLGELEADVLEAEARLRAVFPQQTERSFCYPCYECHVGEGAARQSYVPVIARHFVAARGQGEIANHPLTCDLHYLWSWPVQRRTGAELVGLATQCQTQGRWGIMAFHGVDEGHLTVGRGDFAELCAFLGRAGQRLWVAPVATVAQWARRLRQERSGAA